MAQRSGSALGKGLASLFPKTPPTPSDPATTDNVNGIEIRDPGSPALKQDSVAGPATTVEQEKVKEKLQKQKVEVQVEEEKVANKDRHPGISVTAIEKIVANPYQPRREFDETALKELSESIKENGVIQPLVVRKSSDGYELIAGERRLRAAKLAGIKQVPIVIRRSTDRESLELAIVENVQRQDLNCVDEAMSYFQLMEEFGLKQDEVAKKVGKERATVANFLRLLRLPEVILDDLKNDRLTTGHAKALLSLEGSDLRIRARNEIIEKKLSVRNAENLISGIKNEQRDNVKAALKDKDNIVQKQSAVQSRLANIALELTQDLATKVDVKGSDRRGKIIIHYATRDDLERILNAVQN